MKKYPAQRESSSPPTEYDLSINNYHATERYTDEAFQFLIDEFGFHRLKTQMMAPDMTIRFETTKTVVSIFNWGTLPSAGVSSRLPKVNGRTQGYWSMDLFELGKIRCPQKWAEVESHLKKLGNA